MKLSTCEFEDLQVVLAKPVKLDRLQAVLIDILL